MSMLDVFAMIVCVCVCVCATGWQAGGHHGTAASPHTAHPSCGQRTGDRLGLEGADKTYQGDMVSSSDWWRVGVVGKDLCGWMDGQCRSVMRPSGC